MLPFYSYARLYNSDLVCADNVFYESDINIYTMYVYNNRHTMVTPVFSNPPPIRNRIRKIRNIFRNYTKTHADTHTLTTHTSDDAVFVDFVYALVLSHGLRQIGVCVPCV